MLRKRWTALHGCCRNSPWLRRCGSGRFRTSRGSFWWRRKDCGIAEFEIAELKCCHSSWLSDSAVSSWSAILDVGGIEFADGFRLPVLPHYCGRDSCQENLR